jgi:hypothetical protein
MLWRTWGEAELCSCIGISTSIASCGGVCAVCCLKDTFVGLVRLQRHVQTIPGVLLTRGDEQRTQAPLLLGRHHDTSHKAQCVRSTVRYLSDSQCCAANQGALPRLGITPQRTCDRVAEVKVSGKRYGEPVV